MNENTYKLLAVAFLCTTIAASALALNYNYKYTVLETDYQVVLGELADFTALVDIMIDYGNGTIVWYNETRIQTGADLMESTGLACDIEYQTSDFGSYITKINGVEQDSAHFWLWNYYEEGWQMGPVGADQYSLHDGDIVGWTYTSFQ